MTKLVLATVAIMLVPLLVPAVPAADEQWDRIKYGSSRYDAHREVAYWGYARLEVYDYRFGLGDALHDRHFGD